MKKITSITIIILIVLAGIIFFLNRSIQSTSQEIDKNFEPYRAELSGEYLCLPHKDISYPQTQECGDGIKTDSGEYYLINFMLMSQTQKPFVFGEKIRAQGVVTPLDRLSADTWQKYPMVGIFSVTSILSRDNNNIPNACNADAKICPDGSAVGRTGPACEFSACPSADSTSAATTTYLGGTVTALNVNVSPQEIISDSRCPEGVTCVWEGEVKVRTTLATQVSHGEHILSLGKPQVFGDYIVTLSEVTPIKTEGSMPDSSYRFTFEISKRLD